MRKGTNGTISRLPCRISIFMRKPMYWLTQDTGVSITSKSFMTGWTAVEQVYCPGCILGDAEWRSIVSQPSKCLKFVTFREGRVLIRNWMQVLKWSSWDFPSPLILQKMKEGDYNTPFCEQQYTHRSCYISLFKFKSFDQLIPPKLPQILDIYSVVAL